MMSTRKHTPGLWRAGRADFTAEIWRGLRGKGLLTVVQAEADVIAVVWDAHDGGEPEEWTNALLMAAAPDLLAALKRYVDARNVVTHEDQSMLDQARAAIRKAEGAPQETPADG